MKKKILSSSEISYYIKQPEFRPAFYLSPLLVILAIISVVYLPGVWAIIGIGIIFIIFFVLLAISLRLSVVNVKLKIQNAQTFSIIRNLSIGVIAYDTNFKISIFNPAAEEIFGVRAKDVIEKKISINMANDVKLALLIKTIFTTLAPKIVELSEPGVFPHIAELTFKKPETNLKVVTDRVYDKNGIIVGFIKIITDKTREIALLKAKNEFIEVAAHQLRTPTTAVSWALESLIKSKNIKDEDRGNITIAYKASKKMLKTINDLLDVSKIEEGKFGYNFQEVKLEGVLKDVLSRAMLVASEYGIKLYLQSFNENIEVVIDVEKIDLVLINLIENAIKYNVKNGSVTVSAKMSNNPNFAIVSIEDTGVGIPDDEKKYIFEKFKRGEKASDISPNGTGLGLYIARNIVERHGGKIWFESELNRGTIFYFTIPTNKNVIPKRDLLE